MSPTQQHRNGITRPDHGGTATRRTRESPGPSSEAITFVSSRLRSTVAAAATILTSMSFAALSGNTREATATAQPDRLPYLTLLPAAGPDRADTDLVVHKRALAAAEPTLPVAVVAAVSVSPPTPPPAVPPQVPRQRAARGYQRAVPKRPAAAVAARQQPVVQRRRAVQVAPVAVAAAGDRSAVIAFALAQVGKPYVWAAAGPAGYDCSGLVLAAYARVGVRLPHQTGSMIRYGTPVARAQLQPGDIVFPSSGHVAIYLGGGQIVHAPHPGDHVRVAPLYAFYAARRI